MHLEFEVEGKRGLDLGQYIRIQLPNLNGFSHMYGDLLFEISPLYFSFLPWINYFEAIFFGCDQV